MSTSPVTSRYVELPDDKTLSDTVAGLEEHGFGVEVVDELDQARRAVLSRIPDESSVMTYPSVTLAETGIAQAINDGGRNDSARARLRALDRETQMQEIKAIMLLPDFALGSVHAITRGGTIVLASALGSQLACYSWGASRVIFVVGAQKLVPDLDAARERIYEHCFKLEDARAREAYGAGSYVGKILEIHQDHPGRIHVVLVRQRVGF